MRHWWRARWGLSRANVLVSLSVGIGLGARKLRQAGAARPAHNITLLGESRRALSTHVDCSRLC